MKEERKPFVTTSGISKERVIKKIQDSIEANREAILECEIQLHTFKYVTWPTTLATYERTKRKQLDKGEQGIGKAEVEQAGSMKSQWEGKMVMFHDSIFFLTKELELLGK